MPKKNMPQHAQAIFSLPNTLTLCLLLVTIKLSGCGLVGVIADKAQGPGDATPETARVTGMEGKKVGVFLRAPTGAKSRYADLEYLLIDGIVQYMERGIPVPDEETGRDTAASSGGIQDAEILDAKTTYRYQNSDIWWHTQSPRDLGRRFDLQRVIIIEVLEYATHTPGDRYEKRGILVANIKAFNMEQNRPSMPIYSQTLSVRIPEGNTPLPLDYSSDEIAETLNDDFARKTAGLFMDHITWVPNK